LPFPLFETLIEVTVALI